MPQRILSISGLRGVVGDGLEPLYVVEFAAALGTMAQGGTVVLTRDGRSSGEMLRHAVLAGLTATGCRVIDAGIAATPTCGVLVNHLQAVGGVQITASHNPIDWNGLKPFSPDGSVFNVEQGQRLIEILQARSFRWAPWDKLGTVEPCDDPAAVHLRRILKLVDPTGIRRRKLNVVLDCNHGSGAVLGPRLLAELGCQVHVLGGTPDGRFDHQPEPLREHLTGLCDAVRHHAADVGFAQDPDADRLAIVDNTGRDIGEELTLALCADYVLSHRPGPVVVNSSTSRTTADLAANFNVPCYRSPVGEAHVVTNMKQVSAILGGEGNGGVIEPQVGYVRDSFIAMTYVLAALADGNRTLAEWVDSLPHYVIVKRKLVLSPSAGGRGGRDEGASSRDRLTAACAALKAAYPDATPQEDDGLRLDWEDRWVQVRASNTEPILRIIAEAPDSPSAEALCRDALQIVERVVTSV